MPFLPSVETRASSSERSSEAAAMSSRAAVWMDAICSFMGGVEGIAETARGGKSLVLTFFVGEPRCRK